MTRIFYGWWMVAAGSGIQFMQSFFLMQAFGAYVPVLQEERGWSKTELSGAAALQQVEAAIIGPVVGWFLDRFGPRGVLRTGILLFGGGFMLLSQVETLGAFYGAFVVIAFGVSMSGFFPLNVALIQWFERNRARALSSLQLGLALGGTAVPIVAWSLTTFGWRVTAFASGAAVIVFGLPLVQVIRRRPEDYGLRVDGDTAPARARDATGAPQPAASDGTRDFTWREALRERSFWLLSLGHGSALFVVTAVNVHAISHMKESLGYSVEAAAFVITLMTLAQVGGVAIGWAIGDRYDKRLITVACMAAHMTGLLLLTYASGPSAVVTTMLVGFAVLHGAAWGLRGPLMQAIRADYFGRSAIGMILGISYVIIVIGQVGGPLIAGILADATGSYRVGFTTLAVLSGLGSAFFLLASKPKRPLASA